MSPSDRAVLDGLATEFRLVLDLYGVDRAPTLSRELRAPLAENVRYLLSLAEEHLKAVPTPQRSFADARLTYLADSFDRLGKKADGLHRGLLQPHPRSGGRARRGERRRLLVGPRERGLPRPGAVVPAAVVAADPHPCPHRGARARHRPVAAAADAGPGAGARAEPPRSVDARAQGRERGPAAAARERPRPRGRDRQLGRHHPRVRRGPGERGAADRGARRRPPGAHRAPADHSHHAGTAGPHRAGAGRSAGRGTAPAASAVPTAGARAGRDGRGGRGAGGHGDGGPPRADGRRRPSRPTRISPTGRWRSCCASWIARTAARTRRSSCVAVATGSTSRRSSPACGA